MYQKLILKFPSPYGVSFILIPSPLFTSDAGTEKFPSPYGVSFILIFIIKSLKGRRC